jgi:Tol biopolymer transport system component
VYEPAASPDGKQIAYIFYGAGRTSVRIIGFDGSHDRVLMERTGGIYYPHWSPDGRRLSVSIIDFAGDRTWHIALIDARDGSATRLKSTGWREPELGGFSPDGKFLLYAIHKTSAATDSGIFALAVGESGRETVLVKGPANDISPMWTPAGDRVVFLSDRSGKQDLWSMAVSNGEPRGEPALLRPNVGEIFNLGFTRDGSYFYSAPNRRTDIYVADMDPRTLQLRAAPKRLSERFIGANAAAAWSPDGRSIAFRRGTDRRAMSIVIRSVIDDSERTLPIKLKDGYAAAPNWMPDSRSLLVRDSDWETQRFTLWRVDVETGRQSVALEGELGAVHGRVRVSSDGRSVFLTRREKATSELNLLRLVKRDLESGEETELYRAESQGVGFFGLALSPTGDRLAFSANVGMRDERHLIVVPTAGGAGRVLYRGDYTHPTPAGGVWTRDGRHILAVTQDTKSIHRVWAFPADGGEPRKLDIIHEGLGQLDLSPDGGRILFAGQERNAEVWTIKNLLGAPQSTARSAR